MILNSKENKELESHDSRRDATFHFRTLRYLHQPVISCVSDSSEGKLRCTTRNFCLPCLLEYKSTPTSAPKRQRHSVHYVIYVDQPSHVLETPVKENSDTLLGTSVCLARSRLKTFLTPAQKTKKISTLRYLDQPSRVLVTPVKENLDALLGISVCLACSRLKTHPIPSPSPQKITNEATMI